ncbi:uncharacterized protein [Bos indicus]|uniref:Uncharacterized protein isoform X1 n=1 Tax=Bos indicus TaxID=9915 RepID=A0ABM4SHX0_BOSIN
MQWCQRSSTGGGRRGQGRGQARVRRARLGSAGARAALRLGPRLRAAPLLAPLWLLAPTPGSHMTPAPLALRASQGWRDPVQVHTEPAGSPEKLLSVCWNTLCRLNLPSVTCTCSSQDSAQRHLYFLATQQLPEYSLEGLMLKLKLQYFGHLMQRTDSLEKTLMLGKIKDRRRRGRQRMR